MDPLLVALLLLLAGATLVVQGIAPYLAYRFPRVPPPADAAEPRVPVAVVIAARNEAEEIGGCLETVRRSRYPAAEIVVVDGGSTDGTLAVAEGVPGVRAVPEPPLPSGWVGKNWACWTGARSTAAPWLLFLDADVRLHPDALGSAVAWAEPDGAAMVSFGPRIEMRTFWERTILPFYAQMVLTYFRTPRVNLPNSRAAMTNGQFCLVRRASYDAVGGHRSVAGAVLEDVALARRFRAADLPLRFGWAPELLSTRMYRDRHEMFEGLLKNVHDTRFSALRQLGFLAGLFLFFLLPLAILPLGILLGSLLVSVVGGAVALLMFAKHAAFARAIGTRAWYGLLFPVAVGFYLALIGTSLVRGLRGRPLEWKGRAYPLDGAGEPPAPPPNP